MAKHPINRMFKAFAEETRMRILHLLAHGELCVCDIMKALRLPQSKVSRHLSYLRDAQLVTVRKKGLWSYYALTQPTGKFHSGLIGCLKGCFDEVDILRKDRQALEKFRSKSC